MFRRKEEGLFDNESTDAQEGATIGSQGSSSTTAGSAPASTSIPSAPAAAYPLSTPNSFGTSNSQPSTASANAAPASTTAGASASAPGTLGANMSRPGAVPTASAFRPNAQPMTNDMARNRLPEAKPAMPVAGTSAGIGNGMDKGNKSGRRVLTVGNDILLKGEIATCDRLVIEGKVDATLNDVHTVEIAESGSFKGSASIEDAEISGLFEGDLVVRNRLVIYGTGKVRGKITYGEIEIERGGELTGEIKTTNAEAASSARSSRSSHQKEDKYAA